MSRIEVVAILVALVALFIAMLPHLLSFRRRWKMNNRLRMRDADFPFNPLKYQVRRDR